MRRTNTNRISYLNFLHRKKVYKRTLLRNHYLNQSISFFQGSGGDGPESCLSKRGTNFKSKLKCIMYQDYISFAVIGLKLT